MPRTLANRRETKRIDALIALPLDRFRADIARLTPDEIAALESRIALMMVKQRWALGSHGVERHRAQGELGLLARRMAELRRVVEAPSRATSSQLRLIEFEPVVRELVAPDKVDQAA